MNPPDANDPLEKLLQEQNHYIEDAGFTARVIASLPQASRRSLVRPVLLLGAAIAGLVLSVCLMPWQDLPSLERPPLALLDAKVLSPWLVMLMVLASLVWGMVAASQTDD